MRGHPGRGRCPRGNAARLATPLLPLLVLLLLILLVHLILCSPTYRSSSPSYSFSPLLLVPARPSTSVPLLTSPFYSFPFPVQIPRPDSSSSCPRPFFRSRPPHYSSSLLRFLASSFSSIRPLLLPLHFVWGPIWEAAWNNPHCSLPRSSLLLIISCPSCSFPLFLLSPPHSASSSLLLVPPRDLSSFTPSLYSSCSFLSLLAACPSFLLSAPRSSSTCPLQFIISMPVQARW